LNYELKLYLLPDNPETRRLIGKYLDVLQYPDGRIEIRAGGRVLPYSTYDKLGIIDQGAIVENKRLGHVLQIVQRTRAQRDNRAVGAHSTAHRPNGKHIERLKKPGTKSQCQLSTADLEAAIQSKGCIAQTRRRRREAGLPVQLPPTGSHELLPPSASDCAAG
jgi:hypothetical protein